MAALRFAVRLHNQRRLFFEDALLLFACTCLTVATILLYKFSIYLFVAERLLKGLIAPSSDIVMQMLWFHKIIYAYMGLIWTTIFFVKFCFLGFFRRLINRLRAMILYWRFVVGVTGIAYIFCICSPLIECPTFTKRARGLTFFSATLELYLWLTCFEKFDAHRFPKWKRCW